MLNMCKMHDLVRDLAISMTRGEHIIGHDRQQGGSTKARRLSILRVEELKQIPERVKNQKCSSLRSLLVFQNQNMEVIPPGLSDKLKCLRVLHLRFASFKHLPDSIGELVHLRYLNLSGSNIVELPNSICNLRHLQTLFLFGSRIIEIPKGFSQLQKLRHLVVTHHMDIHAGLGKLTNLQTLAYFTVRNRDGRCNIEDLNGLSQLRDLTVCDLGMVPGPTEAREAAIENKTHLRSLELRGTPTDGIKGEQEIRRMKEILEEFRPNESLECLAMYLFDAREFPGWISMTPPLLRNLNYLELNRIVNLQQFPSLGHLPLLRILRVDQGACKCDSLKTLGLEPHFDRGGNGGGAYPRLEVLSLSNMHELEEWGGGGERKDIFPRLKLLELIDCPKLSSLPVGLLDLNMKLRAGIVLFCWGVAFDKTIYL